MTDPKIADPPPVSFAEFQALKAAHAARVTELLEANNREVERRRAAETRARQPIRWCAERARNHLIGVGIHSTRYAEGFDAGVMAVVQDLEGEAST